MTFTPEQERQIIDKAARMVAEKAWDAAQEQTERLACVSMQRAAAILDVDLRSLRKLVTETVSFGPRETKVRLSHLREIVEARAARTNGNPASAA